MLKRPSRHDTHLTRIVFNGNTISGYAVCSLLPTIWSMRDIGERLQARARELGLSDAEVARRLGLAQGRYSNYANGVREPDFATFIRICNELSITPNEVLGFGDEHLAVGTRARVDAVLDTFSQDKLDLALGLLNVLASHHTASKIKPTDG